VVVYFIAIFARVCLDIIGLKGHDAQEPKPKRMGCHLYKPAPFPLQLTRSDHAWLEAARSVVRYAIFRSEEPRNFLQQLVALTRGSDLDFTDQCFRTPVGFRIYKIRTVKLHTTLWRVWYVRPYDSSLLWRVQYVRPYDSSLLRRV
jgi:hypothetical protein